MMQEKKNREAQQLKREGKSHSGLLKSRGGMTFFVKAAFMAMSAVMLISLAGCKPSEKNYQSAYKAALEKRERDEEARRELQADLGVDRSALQSVDDNVAGQITLEDPAGDESVRLMSKRKAFHRADNVRGVVAAVASMRMGSNASALADDLKGKGFGRARVVRSGEDYIVIIAEGADPASLAHTVMKFRKANPEFPYMGQGEMEIIYAE